MRLLLSCNIRGPTQCLVAMPLSLVPRQRRGWDPITIITLMTKIWSNLLTGDSGIHGSYPAAGYNDQWKSSSKNNNLEFGLF